MGAHQRSVGSVLDENKGIGPGFDFLRVFLALSIVAFHSITVTQQYGHLDYTPVWFIHFALVPMFFALSGFLISASAARLSLGNFLINRSLRIVPALAVDTFVCAMIIGPLFTTASFTDYFTDPKFRGFFLNIIGYVHYYLPGVFADHQFNRVNGSLWTVPFELLCYLMISIMIVTGAIKRRLPVFAVAVGYLVLSIFVETLHLDGLVHGAAAKRAISIAFIEPEAQAVTGFVFGIILFQNRYRIGYDPRLLAAVAAFCACCALFLPQIVGQSTWMRVLLVPALAYLTIFIGLTKMPLPAYFKTGDYSYGIYLYHQPFQQIVICLFPMIALAPGIGPLFTLVACLPMVIGVAWLSWHAIEKPILAERKKYTIMAKARGVDGAAPAKEDWRLGKELIGRVSDGLGANPSTREAV